MGTSTVPELFPVNQLIPSELWASLESNDSALMKEVEATHTPDDRKVDVKLLLRIIDNILLPATSSIPNGSGTKDDKALWGEDKTSLPDSNVNDLKALAPILNKVSYEMTRKCVGGGDAQETTMVLLKTLSNYSWDAKVVLTVAAFALNYAEFFLFFTAQYNKSSSLSHSVALLKQLRDMTQYARISKPKFDAIIKLVKVIIGLTKCIVNFNDLSSEDLAPYQPPISSAMAYIPKAAYWTILSVVVCTSHIVTLNRCHVSTTDPWNLSSVANEGSKIQAILNNQLTISRAYIDEKSKIAYRDLKKLFNQKHQDNMEILKTLIFAKNGRTYLLDGSYGSDNKQISIEELRGKDVLLLISDLDLTQEMIETLYKWYQDSQDQYKIVWLPVLDKSTSWDQETIYTKFEELRLLMPWYIVLEPSKIKPEVIKYIKKKWHFANKMILVAVDPQGKVQSLNALEMLLIWGNSAFPFVKEREESLWKKQNLTLELLFGSADATISKWTKEGKVVCVYGGEDIEWIRQFTTAANAAKDIASIGLEMLYVGKKNIAIKQKGKIIKTIREEKLSHNWIPIWRFWARLESILYLKMQQGKNLKNDDIMKEVTTLLSYDVSDKGWALFCKGSSEMAKAKGDVALNSMKQVNKWWNDVAKDKGFLPALNNYFQKSSTSGQRCHRIILSGNRWEIPSNVLSGDGCECTMEKCYMYSCDAD